MDTITANRQPEAADIIRMVERVNRRLLPQARFDGFKPCEGVYRVGDKGYVTEDAYERAFTGEPEWAKDCYMLQGNDSDMVEEWAEAYRDEGLKGLEAELDWMFRSDHADAVFWTQADERGNM